MGELLIDNSASGGLREEFQTYSCKHCQAVIRLIVKGLTRTREGAYCLQCCGPICTDCAARHFSRPEGACEAFERKIDAWLRQQAFRDTIDRRGG